jgi:hypothetical protein
MSRLKISLIGPVLCVALLASAFLPALAAPPAVVDLERPASPAVPSYLTGPTHPDVMPDRGPKRPPGPAGECYEVIWGDWICFERWTFGCLQWHCVHPGDECCVFVPCPEAGGGNAGGSEQWLEPRL